jgi:hypothetical protein
MLFFIKNDLSTSMIEKSDGQQSKIVSTPPKHLKAIYDTT